MHDGGFLSNRTLFMLTCTGTFEASTFVEVSATARTVGWRTDLGRLVQVVSTEASAATVNKALPVISCHACPFSGPITTIFLDDAERINPYVPHS